MKHLSYEDTAEGSVRVGYTNGICMGEIYMEVDGYYVFEPALNGGFWDGWVLAEIAETLEEMNAPYEKHLEEYFAKKEEPPSGNNFD